MAFVATRSDTLSVSLGTWGNQTYIVVDQIKIRRIVISSLNKWCGEFPNLAVRYKTTSHLFNRKEDEKG